VRTAKTPTTPPIAAPPVAPSMKRVDRAIVTKELGKAQTALWAAFQVAARANDLDLAKVLRDQHKAMGDKIVEINGGPIVSVRELLR
jgi:hypothetical protein